MSLVLQVQIRIKPENVTEFMEKVQENADASLEEAGCSVFDVCVDPKDPTAVMLYEVYADEKAFEQHQQSAHFKKYVSEAVPLLASRERRFWKRVP